MKAPLSFCVVLDEAFPHHSHCFVISLHLDIQNDRMEQEKHISARLRHAVETIKEAILQGQYEASKGVNRIQLAVY